MSRGSGTLAFSLALILGDIVAILGAYSLAYILRVKLSDAPIANFVPAEAYFMSLLVLLPFVVIFFSLIGSYSIENKAKKSVWLTRLLVGAIGAMLFMISIDYFLPHDDLFPAKLVPLYGLLFSVGLLLIIRGGIYITRRIWLLKDKNLQSVVIIGDEATAKDVLKSIQRRGSGYKLQAVVGDRRLKFVTHSSFKEAVKRKRPDVIIQVATSESPVMDADLIQYCAKRYVEFKFVPVDSNNLTSKVNFELFMGDFPLLNIRQTTLVGWNRIIKRVFDLLIAVLAVIILSPILVLVAVINMFVFGKVIFTHTRLTRGNKKFKMYKFQTVRNDLNGLTPEEAFTKLGRPDLIKSYRDNGDFLEDDPRYGAWSRFLRATSLDELPQLFNVLKGDISIVGPRALIPQELEGYGDKHLILNVRSGITGLAQISGRRDLPWAERRKLDIYYVQNWSFGLDVQILLSTAWQILTRRGAH